MPPSFEAKEGKQLWPGVRLGKFLGAGAQVRRTGNSGGAAGAGMHLQCSRALPAECTRSLRRIEGDQGCTDGSQLEGPLLPPTGLPTLSPTPPGHHRRPRCSASQRTMAAPPARSSRWAAGWKQWRANRVPSWRRGRACPRLAAAWSRPCQRVLPTPPAPMPARMTMSARPQLLRQPTIYASWLLASVALVPPPLLPCSHTPPASPAADQSRGRGQQAAEQQRGAEGWGAYILTGRSHK